MKSSTKIVKTLKRIFGVEIKRKSTVHWRYTIKKRDGNMYQVHITGFIKHPYRLLSMKQQLTKQSKEENHRVPQATNLKFEENAYIHFSKELLEMGITHQEFSNVYNTCINYHTRIVNYVQVMYVFNTPQIVKGNIVYWPYTDKKCLSQHEECFEITLQ